MAFGGFIWGLSLVAPPCFAIVGFMRLSAGRRDAAAASPTSGPLAKSAPSLPDDYVVAPSLELPDGRRIRNVVAGPFGLAVIGEAPPRPSPAATAAAGRSAAPTAAGCRSSIPSSGPVATPSASAAGSAPRSVTTSSRSTPAFVTTDPTHVANPGLRGHRPERGRRMADRRCRHSARCTTAAARSWSTGSARSPEPGSRGPVPRPSRPPGSTSTNWPSMPG